MGSCLSLTISIHSNQCDILHHVGPHNHVKIDLLFIYCLFHSLFYFYVLYSFAYIEYLPHQQWYDCQVGGLWNSKNVKQVS